MSKTKIIKCKVCGNQMQLFNSLRPYCSATCGGAYGKRLIENKLKRENKEERAELKVLKDKLLTHKDWIQIYQTTFNTFIRVRDKDLPCISCGTTKDVEYAAGHFIPTTYQYHRFNEDNVHKQCNKHCNMMLRGNLHEYRINLIKKIGVERVEYIENTRHMMLEITIPEIKEKITEYKLKIKTLKNG